jgi:hypothetical protein
MEWRVVVVGVMRRPAALLFFGGIFWAEMMVRDGEVENSITKLAREVEQ